MPADPAHHVDRRSGFTIEMRLFHVPQANGNAFTGCGILLFSLALLSDVFIVFDSRR
jgi:hypothetical protein